MTGITAKAFDPCQIRKQIWSVDYSNELTISSIYKVFMRRWISLSVIMGLYKWQRVQPDQFVLNIWYQTNLLAWDLFFLHIMSLPFLQDVVIDLTTSLGNY